jgi:hypothetical protein
VHSEFYTAAQNDFVLVSLDFPQGEDAKAAVPNPQRNDELQAKYGVQGFPTVMIVSATGEAYGQTGYKDLDPADYFADVVTIRDTGKKALVAVRELEGGFAAAEDKVAFAVHAADVLSKMEDGSPAIAGYADIVRQGMALAQEPTIKIDLLRAAVMATGATEDDIKLISELDPKNEHGLMIMVVISKMGSLGSIEDLPIFVALAEKLHATGNVTADEDSRSIYITCAFFCAQYLDDKANAKVWAQRATDLGGLDERMQEVVDGILVIEEAVEVESDL